MFHETQNADVKDDLSEYRMKQPNNGMNLYSTSSNRSSSYFNIAITPIQTAV